jgi:hypothetical protein
MEEASRCVLKDTVMFIAFIKFLIFALKALRLCFMLTLNVLTNRPYGYFSVKSM